MRGRVPIHPLRKYTHEDKLGDIHLETGLGQSVDCIIVAFYGDSVTIFMPFQYSNRRILCHDLKTISDLETNQNTRNKSRIRTFPPADRMTFLYVLAFSLRDSLLVK